jgi:hypothetical protein
MEQADEKLDLVQRFFAATANNCGFMVNFATASTVSASGLLLISFARRRADVG